MSRLYAIRLRVSESLSHNTIDPMFKAIGLVIVLIALRFMLPTAFRAFEHAATSFFGYAGDIFSHPPTSVARDYQAMQAAGVSYIPKPAPLPDSMR